MLAGLKQLIPMTTSRSARPSFEPGPSELALAFEQAAECATFCGPLTMLPWRDKWEAVMAILSGRAPLPFKTRACDVPFLRVVDAVRPVATQWQNKTLYVKPGQNGRPLRISVDNEPDHTPISPDSLLVVLGLEVLAAAKSETSTAHETWFQRRVIELVIFCEQIDASLAVSLRRTLGIPTREYRIKEYRDFLKGKNDSTAFLNAISLFDKRAQNSGDQFDWYEITLSAERIQTYLDRFKSTGLRRGASAMVAEYMACLREGLVEQWSIGGLVRDMGGSLVFVVPSSCEGVKASTAQTADAIVEMLDEIRVRALRLGGFFHMRHPLGYETAGRDSHTSRSIPLEAWMARGLFPDVLVRVRQLDLRECVEATHPKTDRMHETLLRNDKDLYVSPPRPIEPRCFGCHIEQGIISLLWWEDGEKLCPICTLVAAVGRRAAERVLEAATTAGLFSSCFLSPTDDSGRRLDRTNVTLHLDGRGVGSQMIQSPLAEHPRACRKIDDEVRARFHQALVRAHEAWFPLSLAGETSDKLPFEVLFSGGDDLCVVLDDRIATPFLRGFLEPDRPLQWSCALLRHGKSYTERARVPDAIGVLMSRAKEHHRTDDSERFSLTVGRLVSLNEMTGLTCPSSSVDVIESASLDELESLLIAWRSKE